MTIKTLELIHRLLIEEKTKTQMACKSVRLLQREYEESETVSKDLIERQKTAANENMAAANALEDFESHDW